MLELAKLGFCHGPALTSSSRRQNDRQKKPFSNAGKALNLHRGLMSHNDCANIIFLAHKNVYVRNRKCGLYFDCILLILSGTGHVFTGALFITSEDHEFLKNSACERTSVFSGYGILSGDNFGEGRKFIFGTQTHTFIRMDQ